MSLIVNIKKDIRAALERDPAATSAVGVVFTYPGFQARQHHRLAHTLYRKRMRGLARLVSYRRTTGKPGKKNS